MKQIGKIKKQIDQIRDLSNILTTMKNISLVNITHYEKLVQAVRQYFGTIEQGLQIFLHKNSENLLKNIENEMNKEPVSFGAIVIGSEKGLCGEFNEQIFQFFNKNIELREDVHIIAIGHKIAARLEHPQMQAYDFPSSHDEISNLLTDLLLVIHQWVEQNNVGEVAFFHNQLVSSLNYKPKLTQIFPLNLDWLKSLKEKPWPSRCLPTYTMNREELFYELTQELLFITMYRSFIESLASENAGRLSSMQAAENNIQDRLSELEKNYHLQRQAQITEELFDILSGFEVLKKEKN